MNQRPLAAKAVVPRYSAIVTTTYRAIVDHVVTDMSRRNDANVKLYTFADERLVASPELIHAHTFPSILSMD